MQLAPTALSKTNLPFVYMNYVADRLFEKLSDASATDIALGATGVGLGTLAAGLPNESIEKALDAGKSELNRRRNVTKGMADAETDAIYDALMKKKTVPSEAVRRFNLADQASRGFGYGEKGLSKLKPVPVRVGIGSLGALLALGGLYGALKD